MKFENAKKGIGQIYRAEIMALIAAVLSIVGLIAGIATAAGTDNAEVGLGVGGVLLLAAGILGIVSFIMNLLGISNASKDEPMFKTALLFTVIGIVAGVLQSCFEQKGGALPTVFGLIGDICSILIMFYVISGVIHLADTLGKKKVARLGENTIKMTMGVYCLAIIIDLISGIFKAKAMTTVANVLGIIAAVVMIIAYIYYLRTLSQGSKMFDGPEVAE